MDSARSYISEREAQILKLIAQEMTSAEISKFLCISPETTKSHRKSLLQKLSVKNTAGLVRKGFELGFLTIG